MASAQAAGVSADVSRRPEEEEDNLAGMEQEEVIETAQHGSGSVPANDISANLTKDMKNSVWTKRPIDEFEPNWSHTSTLSYNYLIL